MSEGDLSYLMLSEEEKRNRDFSNLLDCKLKYEDFNYTPTITEFKALHKRLEIVTAEYKTARRNKNIAIFILTIFLILAGIVLLYPLPEEYSTANNATSNSTVVYKEETSSTKSNTRTVFVTPSGKKFHRSDCKHIKGKDCTELSRSDAAEDYDACSVCKP